MLLLIYLNVDGENAVRSWWLFVECVSSDGTISFTLTTTQASTTQASTVIFTCKNITFKIADIKAQTKPNVRNV